MLLNIKKIFFALLLAPAALATPVPGKEMVARKPLVRRAGVDSYRPNLDEMCRAFTPPYSTSTYEARGCRNGKLFQFTCLRSHRASRYPDYKALKTASCHDGYFCYDTQGGTDVAYGTDPGFTGHKGILCMQVNLEISVDIETGLPEAKTGLSIHTPGPSGIMHAVLELTGNVEGFRPALLWKYRSDNTGGQKLLGEKVISTEENSKHTQLYPIKYHFDHSPQFFGAVQWLPPRHTDVMHLKGYISWVMDKLPPPKEEATENSALSEIEEREEKEVYEEREAFPLAEDEDET